jgi:hypothetical protein
MRFRGLSELIMSTVVLALPDVFRAIIDDGQLSKAELRQDLPLLPHDVERLASLPEGWLTLETARVIALRPTAVRDQPESKPSSASVLSLRRPYPR